MEIKNLYKYKRADGGTTISPNKPDCDYTLMYRIIASEGKVITKDGINVTICADVESVEGWYEIDAPEIDDDPDAGYSSEGTSDGSTTTGVEFTEEDMEYAKAGRILLGVEE